MRSENLLNPTPAYNPGDGGLIGDAGGGYTLPLPADVSDFVTKSGDQTISGPKRFGTDTDNTTFEADGTMKMNGAATVWDDINVSLVPAAGGGSLPSVIAFNGDARLDCYAFNGTTATTDEIHSSLEILHGYKEGSDIKFHLHWYPTTAAAGNVKWHLRYTWFNPGTLPGAAATATAVAATSGVAWKEQATSFTLTGTGKVMGSRLVFSLFRDPADAADTYTAAAAVTDMGVHYERDTFGSRTDTAK